MESSANTQNEGDFDFLNDIFWTNCNPICEHSGIDLRVFEEIPPETREDQSDKTTQATSNFSRKRKRPVYEKKFEEDNAEKRSRTRSGNIVSKETAPVAVTPTHQCSVCFRKVISIRGLKLHMKIHAENPKQGNRDQSDETTQATSNFSRKRKRGVPESESEEVIAEKRSRTRSGNIVSKETAPVAVTPTHQCSMCFRKVKSSRGLKLHMKVHAERQQNTRIHRNSKSPMKLPISVGKGRQKLRKKTKDEEKRDYKLQMNVRIVVLKLDDPRHPIQQGIVTGRIKKYSRIHLLRMVTIKRQP